MSVVQSRVVENIFHAVDGQVAETATYDADTYIVEGIEVEEDGELVEGGDIPFGRVVRRGSDVGKAVLVTPEPGSAGQILGISVKDPTRYPGDDDTYRVGAQMAVAYRGDIWIEPDDFALPNFPVTIDYETGRLGVGSPSFSIVAGAPYNPNHVASMTSGTLEFQGRVVPTAALNSLAGTPFPFEVLAVLQDSFQFAMNHPFLISTDIQGRLTIDLHNDNYNPSLPLFSGTAAEVLGFNNQTQVTISRRVMGGAQWLAEATNPGELAILRIGTMQPFF